MFISNLYPKRVEEINENYIRSKFNSYLTSPFNFILEGKENTGKKTLIRAFLCSYWDKDKINYKIYEERINKNLVGRVKVANGILEVNLVHFNVHDKLILSHIVEPFLRIKPHNNKPRFIVIPDMDKITDNASKMIKTLSEKYYKWNIFIGTVECSNSISPSLKSNFEMLKIKPILESDILGILNRYREVEDNEEKLDKTNRLLNNEVEMKKLIKYIQFPNGMINYSSFFYIFTNYLIYGTIEPTVEEVKTERLYESMILLLQNQGEEEITKLKEILFDFYSQHYKIDYLMNAILSFLKKDFDIGYQFYTDMAHIDMRNNKGNRYFIHMECFVFYVLREILLGKNLKRKI